MGVWGLTGALLLVAAAAGVGVGLWTSAADRRHAAALAERLLEPAGPVARYDPAMVADLPDIAQRYFAAALAPGTPLHRQVRLRMEGDFIMNGTPRPMQARQVLAPGRGFVWEAEIGRGPMGFAGSDGWEAGTDSWTKFWLMGVVPLARLRGGADHARAAATRGLVEAIWVPAALLPQNGAVWQALGPDVAEIGFPAFPDIAPLQLTLDAKGLPVAVATMRWSDANADRSYRLQPFGGRLAGHAAHDGTTIPTEVEIANLFGTDEEAVFFIGRLTAVDFGPGERP